MKRLAATFAILIVLAIGAAVALVAIHRTPIVPSPTAKPISTPSSPNPLSIVAIRLHAVTSNRVATTQTLASRGGCATSVVSFTSDGLTEYALLQLPSSTKPAGGYPVMILAHGYIAPTTYQTTGTDYQGLMNAFCGAGYAVIKLDYRGNGQSGGNPTTGDVDPGYTYDLLNLTASLPNLSNVNPKRVAWLGHSMGGAVVLRAAVASHGLPVKAIVLASGVVGSVEDTFYNWPAAMIPVDLVTAKTTFVAAHGTPAANPSFWDDISAVNYLSAITAPVEVNHGTADSVVPIAFSASLDAKLTAAGKIHTYYTYPGGDHQYSSAGSGATFLANTIQFLNQYDQ